MSCMQSRDKENGWEFYTEYPGTFLLLLGALFVYLHFLTIPFSWMIILFGGLGLGIDTDQWQRVMMVMVTGTGNVAGIIRFSAWRSDLVHTIQIFSLCHHIWDIHKPHFEK
jgi:hypothetical protein